jgi:hypothetical protein
MDIYIPVKSVNPPTETRPFYFKPALLIATPGEIDLVAKTVVVAYRLTENTPLDTTKYLMRNWADAGTVLLPLNLMSQAVNEQGALYVPVLNIILAGFSLEVDTADTSAQYAF